MPAAKRKVLMNLGGFDWAARNSGTMYGMRGISFSSANVGLDAPRRIRLRSGRKRLDLRRLPFDLLLK